MANHPQSEPSAPRSVRGWLRAIWSARGHVLRTWLWFLGSLAVMIQLLIWARPFTDGTLASWIASASAVALRLLGNEATVQGTIVRSTVGSAEIIRECTGVYPTALYVAAVLAHSATWRRKVVGIVFGLVAIQVVNIVRVVSLIYVHRWYPEVYEASHLLVWQSLVVFIVVLLWLVWAAGSGERRHAA